MTLKERAASLKTDITAVLLAIKAKETPAVAKIAGVFVVISALSPIDLIPDFIPVLGYLDDIILLPMLIALTVKLIPKEVFERCKKQAQDSADAKPRKRLLFSLPVIFIWALFAWMLIKCFS